MDRSGAATSDCTVAEIHKGKVRDVLSLTNVCVHEPTQTCRLVMGELAELYSIDNLGKHGLLKPLVLDYGRYRGISESGMLVLKAAQSAYGRFHAAVEPQLQNADSEANGTKRAKTDTGSKHEESIEEENESSEDTAAVEDTVGFINLAETTTISTSSGGNFYRLPGRVSCAGVYGTGIGFASVGGVQVSCMCSGNGDDIVRMSLGSYLSEAAALKLAESDEWVDMGQHVSKKLTERAATYDLVAVDSSLRPMLYVGVILAIVSGGEKRLVFCHTTESFYFGFRLSKGVEVVLSRNGRPGTVLHGEYRLD